jgi:hypothetical protein
MAKQDLNPRYVYRTGNRLSYTWTENSTWVGAFEYFTAGELTCVEWKWANGALQDSHAWNWINRHLAILDRNVVQREVARWDD